MSEKTVVPGPASDSAELRPPANPKDRMPAARAASTPKRLSSTTTHRSGATPEHAAACRKRSGAGLPLATSVVEKIRPSKRSNSPVRPRVSCIFSCVPLEATHDGIVNASSACSTPGTTVSSLRNERWSSC